MTILTNMKLDPRLYNEEPFIATFSGFVTSHGVIDLANASDVKIIGMPLQRQFKLLEDC